MRNKRLVDATFDDMWTFMEAFVDEHPVQMEQQKNIVRGLGGIMEIFGCGKTKAAELKRDVIAGAVKEEGGLIITDRKKAIELFNEYTTKKHRVK